MTKKFFDGFNVLTDAVAKSYRDEVREARARKGSFSAKAEREIKRSLPCGTCADTGAVSEAGGFEACPMGCEPSAAQEVG